jgi:uncharacterized membrane protein YfcA
MTSIVSLPLTDAVMLAAVVLAAAFVRGYSGFGFSAVLVAGGTFFLSLSEIVPIALALEVLASAGQFWRTRHDLDYRVFAGILLSGLLGTPLGVYLLIHIPAKPIQLGVYTLIAISSAILLSGSRQILRLSWPVIASSGFVAGVVNGASALSGLVLALMFNWSGTKPAVMRATLIAYFFVLDFWGGLLLTWEGALDGVTLRRVGAALPIVAAGLWLGGWHFLRTTPESFRSITLALLLMLCLIGAARGLLMRGESERVPQWPVTARSAARTAPTFQYGRAIQRLRRFAISR